MKELQHEYFPHDYNASGDEKTRMLLRAFGARGYGLFWLIVELLYQAEGLLLADYEQLAYDLRDDAKTVKRIVEDFGLFYKKGKSFGSSSVDRRLDERRSKSAKAQQAAFARHATAERPQSDRNAINKESKEKKEIKIPTAPSAVDFSDIRFPYGAHKGAIIANLPVDECQIYLKDDRLGSKVREALKARIAAKNDDMTAGQRRAQNIK